MFPWCFPFVHETSNRLHQIIKICLPFQRNYKLYRHHLYNLFLDNQVKPHFDWIWRCLSNVPLNPLVNHHVPVRNRHVGDTLFSDDRPISSHTIPYHSLMEKTIFWWLIICFFSFWRFPEMGVGVPLNHPKSFIFRGFPWNKPSTYWGTPMTMETHYHPILTYIDIQ